MVSHVRYRARSRLAAALERLRLRRAANVPSAGASVSAGAGGTTEPDAVAEPDFAVASAELTTVQPVTVESLRRVLDGLRQLN